MLQKFFLITITLLIGQILIPVMSSGQSLQQDFLFLLTKQPVTSSFNIKNEQPPDRINPSQVSELKLLFLGSIRLYQVLLASQDLTTCSFNPSCSHFSSAAFQRTGILQGLLLTSDRLQRCNGLPGMARHYHYVQSTGKFLDPIENYLESNTLENKSE